MTHRFRGLYAITPETSRHSTSLQDQVAAAIQGGARLIQYRDKGADSSPRRAEARALLDVCRVAEVPLVINDDLDLAAAIGADGVHLGRDDPDPREARQRLGPHAIIGVSCYDQLALAAAAQAAGASYAAFGSFFPSTVKPKAARPAPELLTEARKRLTIPLVAIGGITSQNGALLIAAGADMLAVVTGVFAQPDITAAARAYTNLFPKETPA
ncbi:thiamine phosphate synthase [Thiorhodococcus mannitoliphagus]|uniref:Thiamine-phosphate synthase n=1 Tax=Thiorhodococcus mannitoliphagus TaxID=329406 RepID=A0A6P1DSW2_9GAMM|nr:thiamine phosphate synthase [Thiorhodococcus mannitoliphagus]NEX21198.1 thiamine phosphate synthase [Thiorhodococcus mannitoliphagus]